MNYFKIYAIIWKKVILGLLMNNIKKKIILAAILAFCLMPLFAEDIFLHTRSTFAISQFWEYDAIKDGDSVVDGQARRKFSNFLTGSIGLGMEMVIWDNGRKRGSRLYFKGGMDVVFAGPTYFGQMLGTNTSAAMEAVAMKGGIFYTGLDMDIYIGGSFPKTDLLWGIGSLFYFMFPTYSPEIPVSDFAAHEKFAFYAAPSLLLAYDIFIPNTKFKITPQLRTGITCYPLLPDDFFADGKSYNTNEMYSGFYIDISVAFSFFAVKWKK